MAVQVGAELELDPPRAGPGELMEETVHPQHILEERDKAPQRENLEKPLELCTVAAAEAKRGRQAVALEVQEAEGMAAIIRWRRLRGQTTPGAGAGPAMRRPTAVPES